MCGLFVITLSRHLATSRKVAGSIPNGVIGIFHNPGVTVTKNIINSKHVRANWLRVAAADFCLGRVMLVVSNDRLFYRLFVELNNSCNTNIDELYCLPNIVRVIKSRRMRWVGHVARTGEGSWCTRFW